MFPALFSHSLQATQHSLHEGSCGVYTLTCQLCTSQATAVGGFPGAFTEVFTDKWRHTLRIRYADRPTYADADADTDTDTDERRHSFTQTVCVWGSWQQPRLICFESMESNNLRRCLQWTLQADK